VLPPLALKRMFVFFHFYSVTRTFIYFQKNDFGALETEISKTKSRVRTAFLGFKINLA
jgi:hypothetical protein